MDDKGRMTVFLLLAVLFISGSGARSMIGSEAEIRAVTDDGRFSVAIPAGWSQQAPRPGFAMLLTAEAPDGRFSPNLSLRLDSAPGSGKTPPSLDQVYKTLKDDLDGYFKNSHRKLARLSFEWQKQKIATIRYEFPSRNVFLACKQYVIFRGGRRFLFTGVALPADMPAIEPIFDQMVRSVAIK